MKWLLLLTTMLLSVEAYGVAFCALRDPVQQIKTLYPNYVAYESEVRNIKAARCQRLLVRLVLAPTYWRKCSPLQGSIKLQRTSLRVPID